MFSCLLKSLNDWFNILFLRILANHDDKPGSSSSGSQRLSLTSQNENNSAPAAAGATGNGTEASKGAADVAKSLKCEE